MSYARRVPQVPAVASEQQQRSKLLPLGFAMMIVGIAFPRAIQSLAAGLGPGTAGRALGVIASGLVLIFVVGIVVAIVGIVRNRRIMKE